MSYMVMECHPGFAVVLDNAGRFLKVANLNYQVGQKVDFVIKMTATAASDNKKRKSIKNVCLTVASLAACICLVMFGAWQYIMAPYGSVRMQINPDVQLTVNRFDYVIALEGRNEDGETLMKGYQYRWKKVDQVSEELADRAIEMGYLTAGGTINLLVDSEHEAWRATTEDRIILKLEVHMGQSIHITSERSGTTPGADENTIVIPVQPPDNSSYDGVFSDDRHESKEDTDDSSNIQEDENDSKDDGDKDDTDNMDDAQEDDDGLDDADDTGDLDQEDVDDDDDDSDDKDEDSPGEEDNPESSVKEPEDDGAMDDD